MPVSTPKYKNLFCQTLKKQVLIRGFLLYCLGMNILKISFQYSTYNGKETPFCSEMDKTTSSKQTCSSNMRKEIKTLVIFRMLFAYVSL